MKWCEAGRKSEVKNNWHIGTLYRAIGTCFCNKMYKPDWDIHVSDMVPPPLVAIGKRLMEASHFVNMGEESVPAIYGCDAIVAVKLMLIAGSLNLFLFGCMVSLLYPDWARMLHTHDFWMHLPEQVHATSHDRCSHSCCCLPLWCIWSAAHMVHMACTGVHNWFIKDRNLRADFSGHQAASAYKSCNNYRPSDTLCATYTLTA